MSKKGENVDKRNVLSFEGLKEKHEQEFKMVENHVELDGEMLSYKMYERFPETAKSEYIRDLLEFAYDTAMDEGLDNVEEAISVYSVILLVDKFTDIEVPDGHNEKILYSELLSDFGLLNVIISAFDENETVKMLEDAEKTISGQTEKLSNIMDNYKGEVEDIDNISSKRLVDKELEEKGNKE